MTKLTAGWFTTKWFPDRWWQTDNQWWTEYGTAAPPPPPTGTVGGDRIWLRPRRPVKKLPQDLAEAVQAYLEVKVKK